MRAVAQMMLFSLGQTSGKACVEPLPAVPGMFLMIIRVTCARRFPHIATQFAWLRLFTTTHAIDRKSQFFVDGNSQQKMPREFLNCICLALPQAMRRLADTVDDDFT